MVHDCAANGPSQISPGGRKWEGACVIPREEYNRDMTTKQPADAMGIETPEERVLIALIRAAWAASVQSNAIVRNQGLSPSQYNVLRILRHAGGEGLSRKGLGERMVTPDPDLTRILSGLTRMRAVTTRRSSVDRRSRVSVITERGRTLLDGLDDDVRSAAIASLSRLTPAQLERLEGLLEAVKPEADS